MVAYATWFILRMSLLLRACQDLSVFQGEESDLSPSFRLSRRQTLKQQLLSFAGICSAVQLQLQSLMTARPGGLELCPGWQLWNRIKPFVKRISSFLGSLVHSWGQGHVEDGISLLTFLGRLLLLSRPGEAWIVFLRVKLQAFTERQGCVSVCGLGSVLVVVARQELRYLLL